MDVVAVVAAAANVVDAALGDAADADDGGGGGACDVYVLPVLFQMKLYLCFLQMNRYC